MSATYRGASAGTVQAASVSLADNTVKGAAAAPGDGPHPIATVRPRLLNVPVCP
jgi:hypothetical protein